MVKNKVGMLCYWLTRQDQGRELLEELRRGLADDPVLPKHPDYLAQFGGADNYAVWRAGQAHFLRIIELHAKGYIDQENAAKAAEEKKLAAKNRKGAKQ
jgi:hypothetical protein